MGFIKVVGRGENGFTREPRAMRGQEVRVIYVDDDLKEHVLESVTAVTIRCAGRQSLVLAELTMRVSELDVTAELKDEESVLAAETEHGLKKERG